MKKIFLFLIYLIILLSSFVSIYSQDNYNIKLYDFYYEKLDTFISESKWFLDKHSFYYLFEPNSGPINELRLSFIIIEFTKYEDEHIYFSEYIDIDPEWESFYERIRLPPGTYQIKIYNNNAILLGKSIVFKIYKSDKL